MSAAATSTPTAVRRPRRPAWLTRRNARLATGLVLFAYVTSHLVNHAFGNVSLEAMEDALEWIAWFWRSPVAGRLLYGSLLVHALLGIYAIYERPRLSWRPGEVAQMALGLAIVPLLTYHVVANRLAYSMFGLKPDYAQLLYRFWVVSPWNGALQAGALIVAWLHGCLGLYFWLRLKQGFDRAAPLLVALAVLLPVLALLGYVQAGRTVATLAADEAWRIANVPEPPPAAPGHGNPVAVFERAAMAIQIGTLALVLVALGARIGHYVFGGRRGIVRLTYPDGTVARVPRGTTVLEASRLAGIPHASVCGGRGRCSTCRVRVVGDRLHRPSADERAVLDRVGGGDDIRLACQLRPEHDLYVAPLLAPRTCAADLRRGAETHHAAGEERTIVAMFVDMRGSTRLAERRLPYDTVFVINRFLEAVGRGVADAGGSPNQVLGDGMLALFGMDVAPETAARQALDALGRIEANVGTLNRLLASHLDEPVRFGIGLHGGTAILGEIGDREHGRAVFTAIGDPVNVASRLQGMTKAYGVEAVVSDKVFEMAGLATELPHEDVSIEGREGGLRARLAERAGAAVTSDAAAPSDGAVASGEAARSDAAA